MHSTPRRIHAQSALATLKSAMVSLLLLTAFAAQAQLNIPGNNGQDGAFAPNANIQVDLSQAVTGQWDTTNSTGQGVYDPEQWAVIFRFTEVTIPSNVTVTFKNHPSRAPVIWLVQGNVTIAGTVSLNGAKGHAVEPAASVFAEPGPGGFRGGRGVRPGAQGSAGMGPGGGGYGRAAGSYATVGGGPSGAIPGSTYGNDGTFPLIGGSGGAGSDSNGDGGGGGGGAILIAANSILSLNGLIRAQGGECGSNISSNTRAGGGSGGGIRLIADLIQGSGALHVGGGASAWPGGAGRIRVEANTITLTAAHVNSTGLPQTPPRIFRSPGDGAPAIKSMTLNGQNVPDDPASYPAQDVALLGVDEEDTVPLMVTAEHVPAGSTVKARVVRLSGVEEVITAVFNGASGDETTWTADIPVAGGFSTIQVHAVLP